MRHLQLPRHYGKPGLVAPRTENISQSGARLTFCVILGDIAVLAALSSPIVIVPYIGQGHYATHSGLYGLERWWSMSALRAQQCINRGGLHLFERWPS